MNVRYVERLAAGIGVALAWTNCLAQTSDHATQRVGALGLTFLVPEDFAHCEFPEVDSQRSQWSSDSVRITYSRDWKRGWHDVHTTGKTFCGESMGRDGVALSFGTSPFSILLSIKSPERWGGVEYVSVSGRVASEICRITADILKSLRYTNVAARLKVEYIAPDSSYFVLRNEVGEVRAAIVDDVVTRNKGWVKAITKEAVQIVELEVNSSGHWAEVPITIPWQR